MWISVVAFFSWLFLHPNYQSAPNVNAPLLLHFLAGHFCAQISECAQCECTSVAAFFCWLFLCPKFQSAPNVNELLLPHFLVGYFCAQILKLYPIKFAPTQVKSLHPQRKKVCAHRCKKFAPTEANILLPKLNVVSIFESAAPVEWFDFSSGTSEAVWFYFFNGNWWSSLIFFSTAPAEQSNFSGASGAVGFFQQHQNSTIFQQCQQSVFQRCQQSIFQWC